MKKILFLVFISITTISYASFPISEASNSEFVINNNTENSDPYSKILGIILGFTLGPIGVLVAYVMGDREVVKWAWRAFLFSIIIALVIIMLTFLAFTQAGVVIY